MSGEVADLQKNQKTKQTKLNNASFITKILRKTQLIFTKKYYSG